MRVGGIIRVIVTHNSLEFDNKLLKLLLCEYKPISLLTASNGEADQHIFRYQLDDSLAFEGVEILLKFGFLLLDDLSLMTVVIDLSSNGKYKILRERPNDLINRLGLTGFALLQESIANSIYIFLFCLLSLHAKYQIKLYRLPFT